MADDDDGGAAAAEAHFEALRRFVDEQQLAGRQQQAYGQSLHGAHAPPIQVTARTVV